jgi:hypothetical protein
MHNLGKAYFREAHRIFDVEAFAVIRHNAQHSKVLGEGRGKERK